MWVLTHVTGMEHRLFHSVTHGVPLENLLDRGVLLGLRLDGGWGCRGGVGFGVGSGRVVLIDNGRVYQSKAVDALVQVKTTKFGTNVGRNMLLNISSRYLGGLFSSRQLRGLPSSDGYFLVFFLAYFMFYVILEIKKGCPCIAEIRVTFTSLRLVQVPRHNPACISSQQCTDL